MKDWKEIFEKIEPFKDVNDIPMIPVVDEKTYKDIVVPNLLRCGAIPKSQLKVGGIYIGECRNSNEATWTGEEFEYIRHKFGTTFKDTINHFEDDNGYDLFVPIKLKEDEDNKEN